MSFDQRRQVADQIAAIRKERDLTQEDLARLARVPVRTISSMENGSTPQAGTLRKLADALAAPPAGAPADTAAAQIFAEVTTPMYLQLSGPERAEALREIVLLLAAALDRDRAGEPKEQAEQQH
ncbi:helix-turn-helix transcriptional regulator [Nocardia terpenica]|uniref:helix-turn-helix transcriptional regulator n=1 Tax=Nocardia terpenica TaxID=455432 RepID=UPI002FE2E4F1